MSPAVPVEENSVLKITQEDLKDPDLTRLNRLFKYLLPQRQRAAPVPASVVTRVVSVVQNGTGGGGGGGTVIGATSYTYSVTLSGGTTNIAAGIAPTPEDGDLLSVFLLQPATGNELVTWDSIFKLVTPNDLSRIKDTLSVISFKGKSDHLWWMHCPPLLGRKP